MPSTFNIDLCTEVNTESHVKLLLSVPSNSFIVRLSSRSCKSRSMLFCNKSKLVSNHVSEINFVKLRHQYL